VPEDYYLKIHSKFKNMKKLKESVLVVFVVLTLSVFTGCETYRYGTSVSQPEYVYPSWAPPVYSGIRYYYIPDIECYYDINTREFIFLDHARWIYSPTLPYLYQGFDLNNCFVVIVNSNIYQPWMHHQYYVSHFPRYYYRDYYDHSNIPWVRGYDENFRRAVYWKENERDRARSWDDENLRKTRQFRYSKEDRFEQNKVKNRDEYRQDTGNNHGLVTPGNNPVRETHPSENHGNNPVTRRPQVEENNGKQPAGNVNPTRPQPATPADQERTHKTNYYGKPIGQPVKVERQMRKVSETESSENKNTETTKRSHSGRR
jgi:hypothetical protein